MELIKCAYCLKVQLLSQWGPIAAPVEGAAGLVLSECYFYLCHLHIFCNTSDEVESFLGFHGYILKRYNKNTQRH